MKETSIVKAYSLKVPKSLGESALRLTAKLSILDRDLEVRSDEKYIYIPLNQKPTVVHINEFRTALTHFEVLVQSFNRRTKPVSSAFEIVGDSLPPHLLASFPRAIDFVGDIAIVEIAPELEKHKRLVGEAILRANKRVRTVLAKSGAVGRIFRLREYEVIAGSPDTETTHKENGCAYHLDLRKVYFSPRLSYEHCRVASQVEENETVVDMFAGVGPFSILIAKTHRNVKVYAVDVNPDAVKYLERNIVANRVLGKVIPILGDAREVVHEKLCGTADRVIMNLPESALEYLEGACEALKPGGGIIHYYAFAEGPESIETVSEQLSRTLSKTGRRIEEFLSARTVREVAPFKWQVSVDVRIR